MTLALRTFPGFFIVAIFWTAVDAACGSIFLSLAVFLLAFWGVCAVLRHVMPEPQYTPGMFAGAVREREETGPTCAGVSESWLSRMAEDPLRLRAAVELHVLPKHLAGVPCAGCHRPVHAPICVCQHCDAVAHGACWRTNSGCSRSGCSASGTPAAR